MAENCPCNDSWSVSGKISDRAPLAGGREGASEQLIRERCAVLKANHGR